VQKSARRLYIDWGRGLAVLVMIEAHTSDSWLLPAERSTLPFRGLVLLGGFAAPFFLFLAGLAAALSAESKATRSGNRQAAARAICKRGLQIFILAFLFRLQAFIVSPGGPAVMLLRVDILNVMGPAIVIAGIVWGAVERTSIVVIVYAGLAAAVALFTPVIRVAEWVNTLPVWLQWYLRPAGDYTTFTAFPWTGFVLGGAAAGVLVARVRGVRFQPRLHVALAGVGAAIAILGYYTAFLPTIYKASSFWTSSPTYFAIRIGIMLLALSALYCFEIGRRRSNIGARLARLGESSLFVYWIHVELVYGYATRFLQRHLTLWEWAGTYAVFCAALYGAVLLRDRLMAALDSTRSVQFSAVRPKIWAFIEKKPLR
jgi:uncharacterized membrane protein